MAESKIAALRAASSNAPAAPSGPQALSYPWMTAAGRELVMPVRPPPASPKARRPPDLPPSEGGFKSSPPPDVPPRERVTSNTPGFVDGVTLPGGYTPSFRYNPELFNALRPRAGGQNLMYGGMVPENPSVAPPAAPAPSAEPPAVNMDLGLLEYMNPGRVELGPEPAAAPAQEMGGMELLGLIGEVPYQPRIVEPEAQAVAPAAQPKVPPPPGALDAQLDPQLLRFLIMSDFGGMEAMQ